MEMEEGRGKETYIKTHRGLHHTTNLAFNGSNSFLNDRNITHISTRNMNVCAFALEIFDEAAGRLFVEAGAADHCELFGAALHHPFCDAAANATEAAGKEVGLCGREDAVVFCGEDL